MTRLTADGRQGCVYPAYRETLPGGRSYVVLDQTDQNIADNFGPVTVPTGGIFVMGDNRDDSQDSRYWGFVPQENIIGRPLVIYWSVREPTDTSYPSTIIGRAEHLAYAMTHMFSNTRWSRTLRLVH